MATTLSVIERIAEALVAQLQELVPATASAVVRPVREGIPDSVADRSLYVFQGDPKDLTAVDGALGHKTWAQPFEVYAVARPSDSTTIPIDSTLNELRSKVEAKLLEDTTLGGLAMDVVIQPPSYFAHQRGAYMGILVTAEVHYRHLYADPFNQ